MEFVKNIWFIINMKGHVITHTYNTSVALQQLYKLFNEIIYYIIFSKRFFYVPSLVPIWTTCPRRSLPNEYLILISDKVLFMQLIRYRLALLAGAYVLVFFFHSLCPCASPCLAVRIRPYVCIHERTRMCMYVCACCVCVFLHICILPVLFSRLLEIVLC